MNRNSRVQAAAKSAPKQTNKNTTQKKSSSVPSKKKQTSVAAAYATGQSSGEARIFRNSVDSCRIRHRELLGSITGSSAFTVPYTFSLNPGISATAPWLALEAQGWEKYEFHNLSLCYYTRTGSNIPGSLMLAVDYDAADAAPVSEQIASAYFGTQEDAPWKNIELKFDKEELKGKRYIRNSALAANLDIKTYDVGNAFVCTTDGTAVNWGKVWLEYDVTLYNPQLPAGGIAGSGTLTSGGASIAAATPFGSAPVATGSYGLSATATDVISLFGLPIGGELIFTIASTGTVITSYLDSVTSGLTSKTYLFAGFPAAATSGCVSQTFTINAANATITMGNISATTITDTFCVVSVLAPPPSF